MAVVADQTRQVVSEKRFSFDNVAQHIMHIVHGTIM